MLPPVIPGPEAQALRDESACPCIPPPGAPGGPDLDLALAIARWVADVHARPADVAQGQRHHHRPTPRGVSHALVLYLAAPTRAAALALGRKLAGWAADLEDVDVERDVDALRAASVRALELSLQVTPAPQVDVDDVIPFGVEACEGGA